ncbi:MAG TPA: cytochrome c biogenesis CcdA family protein [Anaerolineales bacterium]|nr:cytochrome c biogenesis CcdA family protein [Anaerolineales bacterium]
MDPSRVTMPLAFLAGLASFLSPCVLALVPAYIGYLSGRSVTTSGVVVENRWATFSHGLAFVLGFSLVFVLLGAAASMIGAILYDLRTWLAKIGGIVVVIFGLHTMGVIHIPFLDYDLRRQVRPTPGLDFGSSFLMGIFFSAGWAPCVGPVLGAVLTLALNSGNLNQGTVLLAAYSAGLAVPFLLAALGIGRLAEWMRNHGRAIAWISRATGVVLVIVGFLLFTGALERLAQFGFFVNFGL